MLTVTYEWEIVPGAGGQKLACVNVNNHYPFL